VKRSKFEGTLSTESYLNYTVITLKLTSYDAVILGGGKSPTDPELPKGNTLFNGSSLAGRVHEAAVKGFDFGRVALVMDPDERIILRKRDVYVEPTSCKGAWLSGHRGIKAIDDGSSGYVLIAGDLAFFDDVTMKAFMDEVQKYENAGILVPLVPRDINEKEFPERKRTYQPLQEGEFLAGNLGYVSREALSRNEHLVEEIATSYQEKMKFILMAFSHLGMSSVLRSNHPKLPFTNAPFYEKLFPKFSIEEINERASKFAGVEVRFVEFPHSKSAFDIDRLAQLHLAEEISQAGLEARLLPASVPSN
jgi:hypothetical protein